MSRLPPWWQVVAVRTETLPPATHTNVVFVGHRRFVVIDPGPTRASAVTRLTDEVVARLERGDVFVGVALTHEHRDHVSGVGPLFEALGAGCPNPCVWAHPSTHRVLALPPAVSRRMLGDGDRIDLGDHSLEALHTPGHARGHLAYVDPESRVVYGGDMVATVGTIIVSPPDGDMAAYMHSLERLEGLDASLLVPSHGDTVDDVHGILVRYRAHRLMRERQVVGALGAEPRTALELVPAAYPGLDPALTKLAVQSLRAHLDKLEGEGRCVRVAKGWVRVVASP